MYTGPNIITDSLVFYMDAGNSKTGPATDDTYAYPNQFTTSNGTSTPTIEVLPNGTTGPCFKLANGSFTNTATVQNGTYSCNGDSVFSVFVKPVEYYYVKLRDGDTTNLQVDFDLLNGTIVGGNNSANGTITSYPNGWFLLTMKINRATPFNYGTRIAIYPDSSFSGYNSTLGNGILYYDKRVTTTSTQVVKGLSSNKITGELKNGTSFNNSSFSFDGTNDLVNLDLTLNQTKFEEFTASVTLRLLEDFTQNSPTTLMIFGFFFTTNFRSGLYFSKDSASKGKLVYLTIENGSVKTYLTTNKNVWSTGLYNITVTAKDGEGSVYINGVKTPSSGQTLAGDYGYLTQSHERATLGVGYYTGYYNYFKGSIYDAKIYSRALTAKEILQNYNATKSRFGL